MFAVKPGEDVERDIAAAMFCIEKGLNPDGKGGNMSISVPSQTEKGIAVTYNYKPSVGIIFYTAGGEFDLTEFAGKIRTEIMRHGDAHLLGFRAISASPCATIMQKGRAISGTEFHLNTEPPTDATARPRHKRDIPARIPARAIIIPRPEFVKIPTHISYRGAFTWIIMNAARFVDLKLFSAAAVNAQIASIIFDGANVIRNIDSPNLVRENLDLPELPEEFKLATTGGAQDWRGYRRDAILIKRDTGVLTVIGDASKLQSRMPGTMPKMDEKYDIEKLANPNACFSCKVPLWGEIVVMHDAREPVELNAIDTYLWKNEVKAAHKITGSHGVAMCFHCFASFPTCAVRHLQCRFTRVKLARSQADALVGSSFEHMISLVTAGPAVAVPDCKGTFVLGNKVVIMPPLEDRLGYLANPKIMALGLPVIQFANIAELP